ncbi:MAG: hypothetical protein JW839_21415 [Candidatus Lokiarchaeota archaeon]|nr:hypothetical protein [Candidatus Lokiarchaeota archaeon]
MMDQREVTAPLAYQQDGVTAATALAFKPTPIQRQILAIAQELLQQHYLLKSEQLYARCLRAITVPRDQLDNELRQLYQLRILVHGKANTRENLLDNQNRLLVYNTIKALPGINLTRLCEFCPLNRGTIQWHVLMLAKFNFVRMETIDNKEIYFDSIVDTQLSRLFYIMNRKNVPLVLTAILENGQFLANDLGALAGVSQPTAFRKLKMLVDEGIVQTTLEENRLLIAGINPGYDATIRAYLQNFSQFEAGLGSPN